jgi:hypothetical protein
MLNQQNDSQRFFLFGKAFHHLSQLPRVNKASYSIILQDYEVKLSPEETILLSLSAYKHNRDS